ncbi:MAG: TetR family transcriptional regulator [Eggerthellaceae bacterium]|nr:TetR family transcriptional regulator [Eggerthellaceae bacterium]
MANETKIAILEAMCRLCESRPFSRLSVVDIAREAGIGRSGFYYHFTDRNDAVQWLSRSAFARGIDQIGRTLSWFDGHYATTRILYPFKPLIVAAAQDAGYSGAEHSYLRHRRANLCETLGMRGCEITDELLFDIEALAASEQHMTNAYIRGELGDMPPRKFCELLVGIVPHALLQATKP